VRRTGWTNRRLGSCKAFSLLEVIIVLGVVAMLSSVFLVTGTSGQRQSVTLDFHAWTVQSVEQLSMRLDADLGNLMPGALENTFAEPVPQQVLSFNTVVGDDLRRDLPVGPDLRLLSETVVYRFDGASRRIFRNGEPLAIGPFERVSFSFFPTRPGDPTSPFGDVLVVDVSMVPVETLGRPSSETPRIHRQVRFWLPQATANHLAGTWIGDATQ